MAVSRATLVEQAFRDRVLAADAKGTNPHGTMAADLDLPVIPGSQLSARRAIALFEAQIESRVLDFLAR